MGRQTFIGSFEPNGSSQPTNLRGDGQITRTDEGRYLLLLPASQVQKNGAWTALIGFSCDLMASTQDEASLMSVRFSEGLGTDGRSMWIQLYKRMDDDDDENCSSQDSTSVLTGSVMIGYSVTVDDTGLVGGDPPTNGANSVLPGGPDGSFVV